MRKNAITSLFASFINNRLLANKQIYLEEQRPWGKFQVIEVSDKYKIKKITVNPKQSLSLQMHYHRSEHWIVINGIAKTIIDDKEMFITENQSVFIPKVTKHRLENPGSIPLEIIEIQNGEYFEENDIVRFQDNYERV